MKRAAATAVLFLAACQAPAAQAPGAPPGPAPAPMHDPTCSLEVEFGSYGGGPDGALQTRIEAVIDSDPGVRTAERTLWGREGESRICVRTRDTAAADRLYDAIARLIPDSSRRAPTRVVHLDGRERAAGWPR